LDKYLRDHPEFKAQIGRIAKVSYTAPTYKVRKAVVAVEEVEFENPESDEEAA